MLPLMAAPRINAEPLPLCQSLSSPQRLGIAPVVPVGQTKSRPSNRAEAAEIKSELLDVQARRGAAHAYCLSNEKPPGLLKPGARRRHGNRIDMPHDLPGSKSGRPGITPQAGFSLATCELPVQFPTLGRGYSGGLAFTAESANVARFSIVAGICLPLPMLFAPGYSTVFAAVVSL
jgi:hypothetical protein